MWFRCILKFEICCYKLEEFRGGLVVCGFERLKVFLKRRWYFKDRRWDVNDGLEGNGWYNCIKEGKRFGDVELFYL